MHVPPRAGFLLRPAPNRKNVGKLRIEFERRQEAKVNRASSPRLPGEDPDIAGIVPGPQPPREDMLIDTDETDEVNEA